MVGARPSTDRAGPKKVSPFPSQYGTDIPVNLISSIGNNFISKMEDLFLTSGVMNDNFHPESKF